MTPDSHEDNKFHEDGREDDTCNGDGEDDRNDGSRDYKSTTPDSHDTTTDKDNNGDGSGGPADTAVDRGLHLHYICVDNSSCSSTIIYCTQL